MPPLLDLNPNKLGSFFLLVFFALLWGGGLLKLRESSGSNPISTTTDVTIRKEAAAKKAREEQIDLTKTAPCPCDYSTYEFCLKTGTLHKCKKCGEKQVHDVCVGKYSIEVGATNIPTFDETSHKYCEDCMNKYVKAEEAKLAKSKQASSSSSSSSPNVGTKRKASEISSDMEDALVETITKEDIKSYEKKKPKILLKLLEGRIPKGCGLKLDYEDEAIEFKVIKYVTKHKKSTDFSMEMKMESSSGIVQNRMN
jgi:hypothetical protein